MHYLSLSNKENVCISCQTPPFQCGWNRPSPGTLTKVHINLTPGRTLDIQNQRISEEVGLERTSKDHLNPHYCYGKLNRIESKQVLKISREVRLHNLFGSLFQCSVTLKKNLFHIFGWNLLYFSLCSLSPVLSLGSTEESLVPSAQQSPVR